MLGVGRALTGIGFRSRPEPTTTDRDIVGATSVGYAAAALRWVGWAVPVAAMLALHVGGVLGPTSFPVDLRVAALGVVFGSLVLRVLLVAWVHRERSVALASLAAGLVFWVTGAAVLNAAPSPDQVRFPAPGEWLFLTAYVGFAAWLVLDRAGASRPSSGGWVDAVIVCGATACLAGFVLVTPIAARFAGRDVPLLAAVIYPLLDAVMLVVVVGQIMLRQRTTTTACLRLISGLLLFTVSDLSFVTSVTVGTYTYGEFLDLAWCLGFLLLGDAACVPSRAVRPQARSAHPGPRPSSVPVIAAAAVALVALVLTPPTGVRPYVVVPAVVTLLATGLRLVLALRESRGLNEALRLSRTDDLTGLPNRRALNDRLAAGFARHEPLGLLLLDLDGFKEINDTLGHAAGDTVLQAIGTRVAAAAPPGALAVRLGGDEFAILVSQDDPLDLLEHAGHVQDVVRKPVRVDGLDVALGASIGVAVRTTSTERPGDLLRHADIAMYQAKTSRASSLVYDAERDQFTRDRLRIAEDLRRGIESGQIEVWYQPKVHAATGQPRGAEALLRWRRPDNGVVSPGIFLPVARRAGLMPALTAVMLRQVVADLATWRHAGLQIQVAVNIAPTELLAPSVMTDLFDQIRRSGIPPAGLIVEVTEDSFLADPDRAREVIEQIRSQGLEVSIDDYGTGFSSLSYLRDLPVQELKIDQSFIAHLLTEPRDHMIVRTTHELAKGLGLRTVAEGVEDAATAAELSRIGIDVLQGFHFARPMPVDQVPGWFARTALAGLPRASGPT